MANALKAAFLQEVTTRYGLLKKIVGSQSLFQIGDNKARLYIRYSAVHPPGNKTFYGLREHDLRQLEGYPSLICFLWSGQSEPLLVPYSAFEEVFQSATPASDGQYKVQIYVQDDGSELYIAKQGRFNVEAYFGWTGVEAVLSLSGIEKVPEFSHSQIQTLPSTYSPLKRNKRKTITYQHLIRKKKTKL